MSGVFVIDDRVLISSEHYHKAVKEIPEGYAVVQEEYDSFNQVHRLICRKWEVKQPA